jgi:membrane associated rhomboid family serine protease
MFNKKSPSSRHHLPDFSIGHWRLDMVTFIIGIQGVFMVLTATLISLGHTSWVNALCYNSVGVWHGQVLRLVTYAFVNPPSLWFALEMLMLYYFGREVEKIIGPRRFATLYIGLILLGSCLLQLLSLSGVSERMSGAQSVHFAIFTAFVAIYPGLPFLFGIAARWMLAVFLVLSTLQFLEGHQFASLVIFLSESVAAIFFMIVQGYRDLLPQNGISFLSRYSHYFAFFRKGSKVSSPVSQGSASSSSNNSVLEAFSTTTSFVPIFANQKPAEKTAPTPRPLAINIDALLEKISQAGMESLTSKEKEELEKASSALVERDRIVIGL